jgi:uncharacterized protein (TIGR00251 family)
MVRAEAGEQGPIEPTVSGDRLRVQAVPRASRSEIAGRHGDAIRIRLSAVPEHGRANQELIRFLAEQVQVPRSKIRLLTGATSRIKVLSITGVGIEQVQAGLGLT